MLSLPRTYQVDLPSAEARFRDLSRRLHPDRFAKGDPRARRASLQQTVRLNEAWRIVKDPVRRAEYLLQLHGYQVGAEEGASRPAAGEGSRGAAPGEAAASATPRERIPVPPELLGEILELREELGEARAAGDDQRVERMATAMRARLEAGLARVSEALENLGRTGGANAAAMGAPPDLERAVRELVAMRYFRRFLDEVAVHEEAVAAGQAGEVDA